MKEIINDLMEKKIGVFPCDTVWGLVGVLDDKVAKKIQEIKHRKEPKPLICLLKNKNELEKYASELTEYTHDLIEQNWPGPLSIIVKKREVISNQITAGKDTICFRVPNFEPLNHLLNQIDRPLISTSCNLEGQSTIQSIDQIDPLIISEVSFIYDKAVPKEGVASKIIECTGPEPKVLRK